MKWRTGNKEIPKVTQNLAKKVFQKIQNYQEKVINKLKK
jgi:hypothetical protein